MFHGTSGRAALRTAVVGLAVGLAAVAIAACREPTEITLSLTTDIPCSQLSRTSIYVGTPAEVSRPLGELALSAEATTCDPATKTIGTIAVIPSGARTDTVGLRVVARLTGSDCDRDAKSGCIDARRTIGFLEHRSLKLPIALDGACRDVVCTNANDTCSRGNCIPALVDPNACASGTCVELGADAGSEGGADAAPTCGPLLPAITYVWHFDEPTDKETQESNGALPPVTLTSGSSIGAGAPNCGKGLVRAAGANPLQLASSSNSQLGAGTMQVAFRFKTVAKALQVSLLQTDGWIVGLSNGLPLITLCRANSCYPWTGTKTLNDGAWHTLELDLLASGARVVIDGIVDPSGSLPNNPPIAPAGFLRVDGEGTFDDLTFHAN